MAEVKSSKGNKIYNKVGGDLYCKKHDVYWGISCEACDENDYIWLSRPATWILIIGLFLVAWLK